MEKLIELLNKYSKENKWPATFEEYFDSHFFWEKQEHWFKWSVDESVILAKKYGFIKRLVENNKINFNKINYPLRYNSYYPDRFWIVSTSVNDYEEYLRVGYNEYETLQMLLSIQDSPIEFLVSILK